MLSPRLLRRIFAEGPLCALGLAATMLLASCAVTQPGPPGSASPGQPTTAPTPPVLHMPPPAGTVERNRSRWVPASFNELPGWQDEQLSDWWPAMRQGCQNPPTAWATLCTEVRQTSGLPDGLLLRLWAESKLQVYRVESLDGDPAGLLTGYFEPEIPASRKPTWNRKVPLYGPPADLVPKKPYWTRQQLDTLPAARSALQGREIAWVEDPLDALILQIQGSGRLQLTESDGGQRLIRLAFAGHNEQPYKSIGRWLIDQGELTPAQASWPGIKDWARRNPRRVQEMLWQNPRYVFFREEPLLDPSLGPKGAQAVPLTPGRSIAVDPQSVPYGTPVWLDTTEPLSTKPLQRLVMAQDTGSAITGAVRADFFWGWGDEAEANAGRMKQGLKMWVLWPKG